MAALVVLFAVVALLLGGQTLFVDALRLALIVALVAVGTGLATRSGATPAVRDVRSVSGGHRPLRRAGA